MTKQYLIKLIVYFIGFISLLTIVFANNMSVQQLVYSYYYSYYNGTINVTSFTS